jgi:septum site-determining protein MinC
MSVALSYCGVRAYLMKITIPFQREELVSKIKDLIQFDPNNNRIFVEFLSAVTNDELHNIMRDIMLEFNKFRFILLGVVENKYSKSFGCDDQYKLLIKDFNIPLVKIKDEQEQVTNSTSVQQNITSSVMYLDKPVRNGVRVEHPGDIVISGLVSHHAEIIAGGSIMVYGLCRGRLIAGHANNIHARIIVHGFCAELVSIAGVFKVLDPKEASGFDGTIMVTTDGNNLKFDKI